MCVCFGQLVCFHYHTSPPLMRFCSFLSFYVGPFPARARGDVKREENISPLPMEVCLHPAGELSLRIARVRRPFQLHQPRDGQGGARR